MKEELVYLAKMIDSLYIDGAISYAIYREMSKSINKVFDYVQGEV